MDLSAVWITTTSPRPNLPVAKYNNRPASYASGRTDGFQMNPSRGTATQPTYNFLTGPSPPHLPAAETSLGQSIRAPRPVKPGSSYLFLLDMVAAKLVFIDAGNEELRVQVNTLRYELENLRQERDLTALRHEKELRDLQTRADADFRKAQVSQLYILDYPRRVLLACVC